MMSKGREVRRRHSVGSTGDVVSGWSGGERKVAAGVLLLGMRLGNGIWREEGVVKVLVV